MVKEYGKGGISVLLLATMKYSFLYYGDVIKINSMMRSKKKKKKKKGGLL